LLQAFDLDLVVADPGVDEARIAALGARKVELPELLSSSDVISIHVSATAQTSPLLGAADLARVRDGATLVNTARGRIIDQDALVAELATGRIDAVLDVTEPEVLAPDHLLHELPNVVLTPPHRRLDGPRAASTRRPVNPGGARSPKRPTGPADRYS